jgi:hypothetical protein
MARRQNQRPDSDPKRQFANWILIKNDLRLMAKFARESIAHSHINPTVQQACFHASVIAYGRCFSLSYGGRATLTSKDVKKTCREHREVQEWLSIQRNKVIAHDEFPGARASFGGLVSDDVLMSGVLTATMIAPLPDKLEEMARFADVLVGNLVQPEIDRLWSDAFAQLAASQT